MSPPYLPKTIFCDFIWILILLWLVLGFYILPLVAPSDAVPRNPTPTCHLPLGHCDADAAVDATVLWCYLA